jgi:hypothetical protein
MIIGKPVRERVIEPVTSPIPVPSPIHAPAAPPAPAKPAVTPTPARKGQEVPA